MALPRRARRIVVDGVAYRWLWTWRDEFGLRVMIQTADGRGEKVEVVFEPGVSITPAGVADAIRRARADGWGKEGA